jgi:parallel beta-helix repeat protein
LILLSGEFVNVRDYGAVADGTTPDDIAIQTALNAALLSDNPAEVFFPTGRYLLTSTFAIITPPKGLHVRGLGYSSELVCKINGINKAAITVNHQTHSPFEISDLKIDGSYSRALELGGPGSNVSIRRCYISGATEDPGPPSDDVPGPYVCAGIFAQSLSDMWILDNTVYGNGFLQNNVPFGYDIVKWADALPDAPPKWSRIHVSGNKILGKNTVVSIAVYDANDSSVTNNEIDQGNHGNKDSNGYGILFYKTTTEKLRRNNTSNNIVRNTAGIGIYLAGCSYCIIQGNILENTVQNQSDQQLEAGAIGLFGGFNTVIGNVTRNSKMAGIAFSGRQTLINSNFIEGAATGIWVNGEIDGSCDRSIISSNNIYGTGKQGILISPTAVNGLIIAGNSLDSGHGQGITVSMNSVQQGLQNATIQNNLVNRFMGHSIIVSGNRIAISANIVTNGGENGIDCRASHSIIVGNIVNNCKRYGYNNAADNIQLRNNDLSGNILGSINISSGASTFSQSGNVIS